jgi:hypothetical protein
VTSLLYYSVILATVLNHFLLHCSVIFYFATVSSVIFVILSAIFHYCSELNHFATVFSHFIILSIILKILSIILLQCSINFNIATVLSHSKMSNARGESAARLWWLAAPVRGTEPRRVMGRTRACSIGRLACWVQVMNIWSITLGDE